MKEYLAYFWAELHFPYDNLRKLISRECWFCSRPDANGNYFIELLEKVCLVKHMLLKDVVVVMEKFFVVQLDMIKKIVEVAYE